MASRDELLQAIKKTYPKIRVDDNLLGELTRRAAEGATVDQVSKDASGFSQVRLGMEDYANAQVTPEVTAAKNMAARKKDLGLQPLGEEQRVAETEAGILKSTEEQGAQRLRDVLARINKERQENDPLARQGIVSGAARDYQTDEQVRAATQIEQDLSTKLSSIAQRLSDTRQSVTERRGLLEKTTGEDITQAEEMGRQKAAQLIPNLEAEQAGISRATAIDDYKLASSVPSGQSINLGGGNVLEGRNIQPEKVMDLFSNPFTVQSIPRDIMRQILQQYGFNVVG